MTQQDTDLQQLVINQLTQAEYESATINPNELYMVTDGEIKADTLKNLTASITELNYTDGVTSNIQTQLNGKADVDNVYTKTEITNLLSALYPVGWLYIAVTSTCPLATLIPNSQWTLVAQDRVLQGAGDRGTVGSNLAQGLPPITGTIGDNVSGGAASTGCFLGKSQTLNRNLSTGSSVGYSAGTLNAANSSSIYGASTNVQPSAYLVNIWQRTA